MQDKTPDVFEEDDRCCAFCEKGTRVPGGELVICPKKDLLTDDISAERFHTIRSSASLKEKIPN